MSKTEHARDEPASVNDERILGGLADDEERQQIDELRAWMNVHGLPEGRLSYELVDTASGDPLAVLDLAWPSGIQSGLSTPVAVLLDEPLEVLSMANRAGFRFFSSVEKFKVYVHRELLD